MNNTLRAFLLISQFQPSRPGRNPYGADLDTEDEWRRTIQHGNPFSVPLGDWDKNDIGLKPARNVYEYPTLAFYLLRKKQNFKTNTTSIFHFSNKRN
jgi:hypothetical protein